MLVKKPKLLRLNICHVSLNNINLLAVFAAIVAAVVASAVVVVVAAVVLAVVATAVVQLVAVPQHKNFTKENFHKRKEMDKITATIKNYSNSHEHSC